MRILRFLSYLFMNLLFNFWGGIPAVVLLVLHFTSGVPIVWFWVALAAWIILVALYMWLIGGLTYLGNTEERDNPNINPYSHRNKK